MKVTFAIPGDDTKYSYPTTSEDVTFSEYLEYIENVYSKAPKIITEIDEAIDLRDEEELKTLIGSITPSMLAKELYPYYARVVSFFTGVSFPTLTGESGAGLQVNQLEALYHTILKALSPPPQSEYEYKKQFVFKDQEWIIPDRLMTNATVIEFAEAAQFESSLSEVENGQFKSLLDVCAVLVRKEGETYTENIYKRNKRIFADATMDIIWNISFFLMNQSAKLSRDFQIYTAALQLSKLKRELKG